MQSLSGITSFAQKTFQGLERKVSENKKSALFTVGSLLVLAALAALSITGTLPAVINTVGNGATTGADWIKSTAIPTVRATLNTKLSHGVSAGELLAVGGAAVAGAATYKVIQSRPWKSKTKEVAGEIKEKEIAPRRESVSEKSSGYNIQYPLHNAIERGQNDYAKSLLFATPNKKDEVDSAGKSPIHIAAMAQNDVLLEELLKRGADVNKADANGKTALALIQEKRDANQIKDENGKTLPDLKSGLLINILIAHGAR